VPDGTKAIPAADALLKDRCRSAVGEVEQVLHADNLGAVRGVPELFEADVAQHRLTCEYASHVGWWAGRIAAL
jgi:hypothetical protein